MDDHDIDYAAVIPGREVALPTPSEPQRYRAYVALSALVSAEADAAAEIPAAEAVRRAARAILGRCGDGGGSGGDDIPLPASRGALAAVAKDPHALPAAFGSVLPEEAALLAAAVTASPSRAADLLAAAADVVRVGLHRAGDPRPRR